MGKIKALVNEFKEFAVKGNAIDLAVGVVIGAAFGAIVNSLVNDIIMPPLGFITGGVDFKDKQIVLKPGIPAHGDVAAVKEVAWRYGDFLNNILTFLIVAVSIFTVIKLMNTLHKKPPVTDPPPTLDQKLLMEIRDLLKRG